MEKHQTKNARSDAVCEQMRRRILKSAKHLILALGYERTTIKQVAQNAGCSVGYIYKHFSGKKEILNELLEAFLDVYEDSRRRVRDEEGLEGVECLRREIELVCRFMVDNRALIPVFTEYESSCSDAVRQRMERQHREDIALLDQARTDGKILNMDPAIVCAVIDGAIRALFNDLATSERREVFLSIPITIDRLIFNSLRLPQAAGTGKDDR